MTLNHVSIFRKVKVIPDLCVNFLSRTFFILSKCCSLMEWLYFCMFDSQTWYDVLFTSLFYNIFWWEFLQNLSNYFFFVLIQLVKLEREHRLWKVGMKRIMVFNMRIETVFCMKFFSRNLVRKTALCSITV